MRLVSPACTLSLSSLLIDPLLPLSPTGEDSGADPLPPDGECGPGHMLRPFLHLTPEVCPQHPGDGEGGREGGREGGGEERDREREEGHMAADEEGQECVCLHILYSMYTTCIYVEDRFETRTVLKPSDGFKSVRTVLKPSGPINTVLNYPDRFETSTLRLSTTPMACSRLPRWSRHIM